MPSPTKVPEAVLGEFREEAGAHDPRFEEALCAAIEKYNELLLGDDMADTVAKIDCPVPGVWEKAHARRVMRVAIATVMKGEKFDE